MNLQQKALVVTIKERCRTCYTCVRECPAKAIRIADGQAEVVTSRCIGCGNCVKVCSQKAKLVSSSLNPVEALLAESGQVAACLAPSFPAEFSEMEYGCLVGMLRALGFAIVHEVGFGADLVSRSTREMLQGEPDRHYISTSCPAIVGYVERYHPKLVPFLQPVVSPMIASAKALRELHGADLKVVFIGPCIAKKGEAASVEGDGRVDEVLTFRELRELFERRALAPEKVTPSEFDPPHAKLGAVFPIARGLLQAAGIDEDLITGEVVTAGGKMDFPDAISEFETGDLKAQLLEVLCCNGCIVGAGMETTAPLFRRRAWVSRYVQEKLNRFDEKAWVESMKDMESLDLARGFAEQDQRLREPDQQEIMEILRRMGKELPGDELNCRACGYDTCHAHAVAIFKGLAESEMCLPYLIEEMRSTVKELNLSHEQLANAQEQLMHSERLASMGQLAAGIAHEVNNPLGVVLLYSHLLLDEAGKGSAMSEELNLIAEQADRCKTIVAGLLNFARQNKVALVATRISDFLDRSLKGCLVPENVKVTLECADPDLRVDLDGDQMCQVITNLISNAIGAMPEGGALEINSQRSGVEVMISVRDTGIGIPPENIKNIFEPFFTTKQMGKGTGLGLAVSYGIVKMHCGTIQVESNADPETGPTGTTFIVRLPLKGQEDQAPLMTEGADESLNLGAENERD
ncbi:MAG: 4Fe-4S dicluster domain-containing protein [bacterium]|nr:4Fe-4S dicluster domain-containing protein [bacterium]